MSDDQVWYTLEHRVVSAVEPPGISNGWQLVPAETTTAKVPQPSVTTDTANVTYSKVTA